MRPSSKTKAKLGFCLGGLAVVSSFILFQLFRHPETAALLVALPGPAALSCNIQCLGIGPFLQVLGEGLKALLLISLSTSFIYALFRMASRTFRTWSFVAQSKRRAVPDAIIRQISPEDRVTVYENRLPSAFTAGFFSPEVFVSTGLLAVLDENELRAVLLHELHHQECKDPLKSLAVSFVSDFLFFLPVSRFLKKSYHLAAEMTADAHSVARQANPLDLASSLLKVQKLNGPAASWFFDPTTERAKQLLGQPATMSLPLKKAFFTLVLLVITVFFALVPIKKSVSSMFINHDKTCVLRSGHV
ncbi:MAG: M56 family metallopeptidase [Candidatus Aminicenantales bacterium]